MRTNFKKITHKLKLFSSLVGISSARRVTLHLLKSPQNVSHLKKSIAQYHASKVEGNQKAIYPEK